MNLLIVDDHPTNLKLLRVQLEAEGHSVTEATNGVEALEVLSRERVDGVISDILMPVMDGFRLCLEIRKSDKCSALPFILYTSTYNSPSDRELGQTVGADAYLTKPSPTSVILKALDAAAHRSREAEPPAMPHTDETYVLKQYNEALVRKLEEKNTDLLELNRDLESRVQQRTADLETANRELESFSYSVSHDLRAPLRGIDGFAGILRRDHAPDLTPDAIKLLERIEVSVEGMGTLIDALLEFSRLGRKALSMQRVNLAHLARECLKELAPEQEGRNVKILIDEMPPCHGDVILLKQVLLNLLSNALKYTRKRDPALIEIGVEKRDGEYVCRVRDNGAGFDMKYSNKLFEVFQRMHSRSEFEGTGVGLALVKRVIERHGGRVWAEAEPGKGATFYFSLPAEADS